MCIVMDMNSNSNLKFTNTTIWELGMAMDQQGHVLHDPLPLHETLIWPNYPPETTHHHHHHISSSSTPRPTQLPTPHILSNQRVLENHNQQMEVEVALEEQEGEEAEEEELGAMKEMMYKIAAMQPVDIDPATIRRPKRRNVRISDDPQSVAARHRRERISEKIRILQRLVPGGTKMDTASMLDEAIRYVKFLKRQIRHLQSDSNPLVGTGSGDWPPHNKPALGFATSAGLVAPSGINTITTHASCSMEPPGLGGYVFGGGGGGGSGGVDPT